MGLQRTGFVGVDRLAVLQCNNTNCQLVVTAAMGGQDVRIHWPSAIGGKDFPDVPEAIASSANEAHLALSVGAFRAAIAMARAVVEAIAKANGITSGTLMSKIDGLRQADVISEAMKEAAHEIRFAGNEVAHGDLVTDPLTREDAEEVLGLMDAIILRVYQEPAQVARVRERRESRTGGSGTTPAPSP
ncbi:hypothetical protein Kfla_2207 [Kribbella flavida DSM 17836]|uniref:DUF4145 domain-containing protein n=2 Tax=Kribbella flavida TaxID=182640 RepID=D2PTH0_KRIFD|nr:hypothetical protein Kfla_2207 [Kribbella flavida DSM 17836]